MLLRITGFGFSDFCMHALAVTILAWVLKEGLRGERRSTGQKGWLDFRDK